jgi:MFS family permease
MRWLNRTVAGAGITSALGDFCYETTTVILPGFFAVLGVPAAALGMIEGVADAVASSTKMASGFIADRFGYRKTLVALGYGLTPAGQVLIALASGWPLVLAGRVVSWFGKGIRGPLRDAIVVQAVTPETRGRAFGFHRSLDSIGAVGGPLLGVALLGWAEALPWPDASGPFRVVLWLSLVPGMLAVVAFTVLVRDPRDSPNPALTLRGALGEIPPRFRRYLRAVGLFGLGDYSHTLLILAATQLLARRMDLVQAAQLAGLLYVVRNAVVVAASFPIGALADRVGSLPVLVGGYAAGVATAVLTVSAFIFDVQGVAPLAAIFVFAGLYSAVQDALESTVAADIVGKGSLATGYGLLGAVNGVAKFASSSAIGLLWTLVSPVLAFAAAAALMAGGTVALARLRG